MNQVVVGPRIALCAFWSGVCEIELDTESTSVQVRRLITVAAVKVPDRKLRRGV